jgi:mono/diheme cytochrome c family protein
MISDFRAQTHFESCQSMGNILISIVVFLAVASACRAQEARVTDVRAGHRLAIMVCGNCHVAAPDQPESPILRPPAESFASIAQRETVTVDWVENYLKTTHRGLDRPKGMPNPQLLDFQAKQVAIYLLSLRKNR